MNKREEILNLVRDYYQETFATKKEYAEGDIIFINN